MRLGGELHAALGRRLRQTVHFMELPPRVTAFYLRAWQRRALIGDAFSLWGATKPRDLAPLLRAARGSTLAVEVGTGTGWTSIALALADSTRRVITFDPVDRPERARYLSLVGRSVAGRVDFRHQLGEMVPDDIRNVDFLFIDANHDRESTRVVFDAWRPRLRPGAIVAFHDFNDPQWPGVTDAIRELGLKGRGRHHLFLWRNPHSLAADVAEANRAALPG